MLKNWDFLVAEIWAFLAIASILTFLVCWFVWGRAAVRANIKKLEKTEQDLSKARSALTQSRAEIQRAERKQEELKERLMREHAKMAELKKQANATPSTIQVAQENMKTFFEERRNGDTPDAKILDTLAVGSAKLKDTFKSFFKDK